MIGWIIFAVVLALLSLFLFSGVRMVFRYENAQVFLQLRWLFIRCQLLPGKEKKEKPPKEKKQTGDKNPPADGSDTETKKTQTPSQAPDAEAAPAGEKKKEALDRQSRDLRELFEMARDLLQSAKKPLGLIYRHLWVEKLDLQLVVAREDAAQTAIAYGQMNGWVYGAWAALSCLIHMKKGRVRVLADYLSAGDRLRLSFRLRLRAFFLLGAGIRFGFHFLRKQMKK